MRGLELNFNGVIQRLEMTEDTVLSVCIYNVINERSFIYVGRSDYKTQTENIWQDYTPIKIGDVFEIKMTDIQNTDPPVKSLYDINIKTQEAILESFYKLEASLKEKGLL